MKTDSEEMSPVAVEQGPALLSNGRLKSVDITPKFWQRPSRPANS